MSDLDIGAAGYLDIRKLGEQVLKIPLVLQQLGHTSTDRADTYMHSATPEAEFVADVVWGLSSKGDHTMQSFMDKWFDGGEGARILLEAMWAHHTASRTRTAQGASR